MLVSALCLFKFQTIPRCDLLEPSETACTDVALLTVLSSKYWQNEDILIIEKTSFFKVF